MAPFFIPAFLLFFAGISLAEIISLKSPKSGNANQITDLSTDLDLARNDGYTFSGSSSGTGVEDQFNLVDVVLVASVDGKLHALNRTTGDTLWSMTSPISGSAPATLGPLVRTQHPEYDPDTTDDDSESQEVYVIEPQSGEIYVMSSPDTPLQRLPFTMPQLVDMSPFSFSADDDRRVFVGKKQTSLLLVELETGKVKATLNSEACLWDPFEDLLDTTDHDLDLDELDGTIPPRPVSKPTEVFIGRTDYQLSILIRPLGSSSARQPVQNLSFSTYGPNNQDLGLQTMYRKTADDTYIQSLPNGKILSFRSQTEPTMASSNAHLLWASSFSNPIVAVFDVLKAPKRQHPFVLLQPRPRLQDILPNVDLARAAKQNRFPNLESAYVGLIEETGSLFAMSPDRYPLVVFGDTNVDDDYGVGRSIDPPPGSILDSHRLDEGDLPPDVDAISRWTKKRKLKEMCRKGSRDKRCLTGVRRLESSRLSRLLDGAPSVPLPPYHNSQSEGSAPVANGLVMDLPGNTSIVPPRLGKGDKSTAGGAAGLAWGTSAQALSAFALCALALLSVVCWIALRKNLRAQPASSPPTKTIVPNGSAHSEKPIPVAESTQEASSAMSAETRLNHIPEEKSGPSQNTSNNPAEPPASPPARVSFRIDVPPSMPLPEPDDLLDVVAEGDDSDVDAPVTPGKRKGLRRKRGKKKKGNAVNGNPEDAAGDNEPEKTADRPNGELQKAAESTALLPSGSVVLPPSPAVPVAPSLVVSDTILGFGSHGTVVYKGSLQGRAVAVKRLLHDFVTLAAREVNVLQESDDHPNVIRYYYQEAQGNFLYIALELCPASLADVVERPDQFRDIAIAFDPKRALQQITSGLRHLHALKIVHRDIKPQNILISHAKKGVGESAGHRMLISDFGLCKKLEVDQTSFLPTAHGAMAAGTVGWRAPEILRGEVKLDDSGDDSLSSRGSVGNSSESGTAAAKPTRLTKSVDIFALGCLFYYVLTNGGHPFGDRFERDVNIWKNAKCLDGLERFGEEGSEAVDLITKMLSPEARERPDTATCLTHPYFWNPGKRLNFLQDASDRFEIMCRDPRDPMLVELERDAFSVVGNDWNARLDKWFIENLGKFRKYDGRSVQDLLRALRNKKHHYQDLPDNVKRQVGPMPEGFLSYFTRRFPRLFLHVHSVIAASPLRHESMFRTYFELSD